MPAIPAIIYAGATIGSAYMASKANKQATEAEAKAATDAATTQAGTAKEALDFTKDVYKTRRGDLSNQIGSGSAAAAKLADLMGLQIPQQAQAQGPQIQPAQPNRLPGNGQNFPASMVPGWAGSDPSLANQPTIPMGGAKQAPQGATMAGMAMPRGGGVQMVAPDGSSRLVPESLVPLAEARGAKRAGV